MLGKGGSFYLYFVPLEYIIVGINNIPQLKFRSMANFLCLAIFANN
jgi:hypothetical protein